MKKGGCHFCLITTSLDFRITHTCWSHTITHRVVVLLAPVLRGILFKLKHMLRSSGFLMSWRPPAAHCRRTQNWRQVSSGPASPQHADGINRHISLNLVLADPHGSDPRLWQNISTGNLRRPPTVDHDLTRNLGMVPSTIPASSFQLPSPDKCRWMQYSTDASRSTW